MWSRLIFSIWVRIEFCDEIFIQTFMLLGGLYHWANTNLHCIKLSSVSINCCGMLFSLTCSLKVAGYLMIFKMIQFISITKYLLIDLEFSDHWYLSACFFEMVPQIIWSHPTYLKQLMHSVKMVLNDRYHLIS